jgi:hypothetical protein
LLARYTGDFVAARVAHESPSDRQLRISRPNEIVRALERSPNVEAASTLLTGSAVVAFGSKQYPVDVRGIEPLEQDRVTPISQYVKSGSFRPLANGEGILLGNGVDTRIGAKVDDIVTVGSPLGLSKSLKVVGISTPIPLATHRAFTCLARRADHPRQPDGRSDRGTADRHRARQAWPSRRAHARHAPELAGD